MAGTSVWCDSTGGAWFVSGCSERSGDRCVAYHRERVSSGQSAGVDFQILGPVRVLRAGTDIGVGGMRRKALLALLIIHRGEVVAADRIADVIWDGRPPAGAIGTVQSHVSHLRRALGADARMVVTRPPGYVLDVAAGSVDACRFEESAERGRSLAMGGDHVPALASYDVALALWRGPPLADLGGLEFAERETARLEQVRLSVVELPRRHDLGARRARLGRCPAHGAGRRASPAGAVGGPAHGGAVPRGSPSGCAPSIRSGADQAARRARARTGRRPPRAPRLHPPAPTGARRPKPGFRSNRRRWQQQADRCAERRTCRPTDAIGHRDVPLQ